MGDFLGFVRIRVDRSKPLCETPEVYLDTTDETDLLGNQVFPPGTVARLFLSKAASEFYAVHCPQFAPVSECVVK
jgi:hypothetical protein